MDLNALRNEIDLIDDELVQLFVRRMEVSAKIAQYKKANGLPILDAAREQEKLSAVAHKADPAMATYVKTLYSCLFALSRSCQSEIISPDSEVSQ